MRTAALLRAAVEHGDHAGLADAYAPDAVLDAGLPGERVRAAGREAVAARVAALYPGRGRIVEWDAREHDDGAAVWVERVDADGGAVRQRHYLRTRDGSVARHWIYAAPPRTAAPGLAPDALAPPPVLLARWGAEIVAVADRAAVGVDPLHPRGGAVVVLACVPLHDAAAPRVEGGHAGGDRLAPGGPHPHAGQPRVEHRVGGVRLREPGVVAVLDRRAPARGGPHRRAEPITTDTGSRSPSGPR